MASRRGRTGRPHRAVTHSALRKDILVFVEGERTEEDYIRHWHRANRFNVNVRLHPQRGMPRTLVETAAAEKRQAEREEKRGRGRAYDEVWCVFDVDDHPRLHEVEPMARDNGIHLAVSNPCIELWFMLHFRDQTAYIHRADAQRAAAECLACGKTLSTGALAALEEHHSDARARAIALDAKHQGDRSLSSPMRRFAVGFSERPPSCRAC